MTTGNQSDPAVATLQADIDALRLDVASLMAHLKVGAANGARSATEFLEGSAHRIYRDVATEGGRAVKAIGREVEKQPLLTVLVVLCAGYIGGRLLSR